MQRAWNPHCSVQINWKFLQLVSIIGFSQYLEIVGNDFWNILQSQKITMMERTNCETSHINEHKARLPGLGDSTLNALKEVPNETNFGRANTVFVQNVSKTLMKVGDEKGVNYVYLVDWINPKVETQKSNVMIIAENFMRTFIFETREATEGIWLYFKDPLKQEQTLLYPEDTIEVDSVHYLFDQDKAKYRKDS